jgi:hypothetical protein
LEDKEKQNLLDSIAPDGGSGYGGLAAELERGKRLSAMPGGATAAAAAAAAAELKAEEAGSGGGSNLGVVQEGQATIDAGKSKAKQEEVLPVTRGRKKSTTLMKRGLRMSVVAGEPILQGIVEKKPGKGVVKRYQKRWFELSGHYLRYFGPNAINR